MPLRRRGMRASFSQGLQRDNSGPAPTDSAAFDIAYCPVGGNLYMYDLANSSSHELEEARRDPPVSTMHHDPEGYVWLGYKGGFVRVWSDSRLTPVCLPLKCFHADVKVIVSDGQGAAWVGSESGNVRRVELKRKEVTANKAQLSLESIFTLRHHPKSRRCSTQLGSSASTELDDMSRAGSARASEDFASEEPAIAPGSKAHAGPVTAIEMHRNTVYTSGGSPGAAALHEWTQGGFLHHAHKLRELGVARAIRVVSAVVTVRLPADIVRQRSSDGALSAMDTSSLSSVTTQSPDLGNTEPPSGLKRNSTQVVSAHDNGQVQVWDMSTGFLQPVLRMGLVGPSARCLVVCKSLGIFATAHADGKLYLRALPDLEAGGSPTVIIGEQPVGTLSDGPAAIIQAHRSGMVSAIGANTGIITCGIFGSVMWWPEAELRSSVEGADIRLPSEDRARSLLSGSESPRSAMSKVLHRYFTPSSAALAEATLQRMHGSGDLQGSKGPTALDPPYIDDSVDLDDVAPSAVQPPVSDQASPLAPAPQSAPEPAAAAVEQAPPPQAVPAVSERAVAPNGSEHSSASTEDLKRLQSSGPAAQQFLAEVSRILEEGNARQESSQEMTGKIARAASNSNLPSLSSHPNSVSARDSLESASARNSDELPSLANASLLHVHRGPLQQATEGRPSASSDVQSPLSLDAATKRPPFTSARLTQHDAAQPSCDPLKPFESVPQQQPYPLRKSLSIDRDPRSRNRGPQLLQKMKRSSSSGSVISKMPNSQPDSLSDTEAAAYQQPTGSLVDTSTIGRGSASSLSSSIFGEPNQWVIDYNDLTFRKVIGEGSIGRVHLGRWQETDVAIKVLGRVLPQSSFPVTASMQSTGQMSAIDDDASSQDDVSNGEDLLTEDMALTVKTLEREVSIMSAIRHPNVVLFMGVCLDPPCMVTEFCARGSMFDVLAKARSSSLLAQQLDWPKRLSMALDAAKGMLQLHSHKPPILHRDLKSPNLLVDKHWRVKIADFNLSRVMEAQAVVSSISANNPRWLAPEVVTDQAYSTAADVYSFGLILWELLTWQLPWADLGPFQIMVAIAEKQRRPAIPPESELPGGSFSGLPAYLDLMQACWAGEPQQRPGFESCIITLRGLLEQAMASKSQQKAAGRASSPARQPAPLAERPHASAPVPPTLPGLPQPVLQRPSVPDGFRPAEPSAESSVPSGRADVQSAFPDTQQLQSNLMRPATPPLARLQAAAEGQAGMHGVQAAGRQGPPNHQAPPPEPSLRRCSTEQPGTASLGHSMSNGQPAHIRSRDALIALRSQGGWDSQDQARLSIHSQSVAARRSLQGDEAVSSQQQPPAQMQLAQQQQVAAGSQPFQRPRQDFFPGDMPEEGSRHSLHQLPQQPAPTSRQWDRYASEDEDTQEGAMQPPPPRRSMHYGPPKDALNSLHRTGSQSRHMSPFAGFAALTMTRSSMDERPDHRPGTGPESHRMSLEQAVGRGKFIKALPQHVRSSLDASPSVRKCQAPPPASSSGMRNSRDGISAESAEQASERWTEDRRRKSLENSQQQQHQEQLSGPGSTTSTIQESSASALQPEELQPVATRNDVGGPERPPQDTRNSGLSKFSPFAASGLFSIPPFD
ncbi:hypothetical protein ABBQ32_010154 [Trebouxia sp. C0010 RCD-2024]